MQAYKDILKQIKNHGVISRNRTGVNTKKSFGLSFRHHMSEGFPLLTTKEVNPRLPLAEMFGFLSGATNVKEFKYLGTNIWNKWGLKEDFNYEVYDDKEVVHRRLIEAIEAKGDKFEELYTEGAAAAWQINLRDCIVKASQQGIDPLEAQIRFQEDNPPPKSYLELLSEYGVKQTKTKTISAGSLGPIYGKMWRQWPLTNGGTVDQLGYVVSMLRTDPEDRRMVVSGWHPEFLPRTPYMCYPNGAPFNAKPGTPEFSAEQVQISIMNGRQALPPCHLMSIFNTLDKPSGRELNLHVIMRSCDVPVGLPYNIAGYAWLLHLMAKQSKLVPGELLITMTDAHIYEDQMPLVVEQLDRPTHKLPTLEIPEDFEVNILSKKWLTPENTVRLTDMLKNYISEPAIKYPVAV